MIIKDDEKGLIQVIDSDSIHASFTYMINNSISRSNAKIKAASWRDGYLYALLRFPVKR